MRNIPTHAAPDHDPRDTIGDAVTRGGVITDDDLEKEEEETEDIEHQEPPRHTAWEDDTSDGQGNNFPDELKEPGSERYQVAGRGPGKPLANVAALEDVAPDGSDDHSLKDTGDSRTLSKKAGLEDIASSHLSGGPSASRTRPRRARASELYYVILGPKLRVMF